MGKSRKTSRSRAVRRPSPAHIGQSLATIKTIVKKSPAHRALARRMLGRLHELSNRVGMSLRHRADGELRLAASLLVIGTLALFTAACEGEADWTSILAPPGSEETAVEQTEELASEIAIGLPNGRSQSYEVKPESLTRDQRGIYSFDWLDPASNTYRTASVTSLRIAQTDGQRPELQMNERGEPTLALPPDVPIGLVWPNDDSSSPTPIPTVGPGTPTPSAGTTTIVHTYYPGYFGYHYTPWFPLFVSSGPTYRIDPTASQPAFRDPPTGSTLQSSQPSYGSVPSESPKPFGERTISRTAVSGMKGGTGSGSAVTGRSSSAVSGMSRGTGAGTAASGKSGGSSGVSAPRSGGFSSGRGGGGGRGGAS